MVETEVGSVAPDGARPPRVRESARDALGLVAFSAAASVLLTVALLLVAGSPR